MLIACAVYDTPENQREQYTIRTIENIAATVSLSDHRVYFINNGSTCPKTIGNHLPMAKKAYGFNVIDLPKNLGTAGGINKAWRLRHPGEACVKMDNDVVVHEQNWPDRMQEVFDREPRIGICCLKRKDLGEWPNAPEECYRTTLVMLNHIPGKRWIVVEQISGPAMGTCQAYSSALLDKIGYLYQMQDEGNCYGWDDSLASARAQVAGFAVVFLPHIDIDHIDVGGTEYTKQKQDMAGRTMVRFEQVRRDFMTGARPVYWEDPE